MFQERMIQMMELAMAGMPESVVDGTDQPGSSPMSAG